MMPPEAIHPSPLAVTNGQRMFPSDQQRTLLPYSQLETMGITPQIRRQRLEQQRDAERRSIIQTLEHGGFADLAADLPRCHDEMSHRRCNRCGHVDSFYNHCDLNWCPNCQRRLTAKRRDEVEFWAQRIAWPMHLVLTVRNRAKLTDSWLEELKRNLAKLRRSACFRGVAGGLWSLEITNESRGWHVHFHLLIDCEWLDTSAVAVRWGRLNGQAAAIIKAKRVTGKGYLREVVKYTAKGASIAHWPASEIAQFVVATHGQRTFGTFGSLFKARADWSAYLEDHQPAGECPDCGADDWSFYNEDEWEAWLIENEGLAPPPRPTNPRVAPLANQIDLANGALLTRPGIPD